MNNSMKNLTSVVIAAAGKGTRMGIAMNKQYVTLQGKPVLALTIQQFENCDFIDEIIVVANEAELEYCRRNVTERYAFTKVKAVVSGGTTRQQSVYNGLCRVSPECGIVLIHDGARPFIDAKDIKACIVAAQNYGAAVSAVPARDTIKRADSSGFISETVDRNGLWHIQTPQAFRRELIMKAHAKAAEDGFDGTDDAVLAERAGHKVRLVMGSYNNIKITAKEDLIMAEALAKVMHGGLN
jgi:2-C-methyl-D-erythritol 4-phosphate cytidylyltransferase